MARVGSPRFGIGGQQDRWARLGALFRVAVSGQRAAQNGQSDVFQTHLRQRRDGVLVGEVDAQQRRRRRCRCAGCSTTAARRLEPQRPWLGREHVEADDAVPLGRGRWRAARRRCLGGGGLRRCCVLALRAVGERAQRTRCTARRPLALSPRSVELNGARVANASTPSCARHDRHLGGGGGGHGRRARGVKFVRDRRGARRGPRCNRSPRAHAITSDTTRCCTTLLISTDERCSEQNANNVPRQWQPHMN